LPNPQSYDLTTSGVVLDRVTGLMWERAVNTGSSPWSEASAYCSSLTLSGFADWRLPTLIELLSLLDYTQQGPLIDPTAFPNTPFMAPDGLFWSASAHQGSTSQFWFVHFAGSTEISQSTSLFRVRCVREAQAPATAGEGDTPPLRYSIQNGVVADVKTHLS